MSNPTAMSPRGRVLLGVVGDGDDWSELRGQLLETGWQVDIFEASPRTDRRGPEQTLPRLDGIDMGILIVSGSETRDDSVAVRSLIHLAGVLQGKLGYRRVLVLVEGEVGAFLGGTGVAELPYERGNIRSRFPQLNAQLGEIVTPNQRSPFAALGERMGMGEADDAVTPELLLYLSLFAVVAIGAAILGFQLLRPGGDDEQLASESTEVVDDVGDESVSGPTTVQVDEGLDGLPSRCEISVAEGVIVEDIIDCDGLGGVRVSGFFGPWHREVSIVSVDTGVVGEVFLTTGDSTQGIELEPVQDQSIEQFNSLFGVERFVFDFTAGGQEVVIHQRESRGGNEMRIVFDIDL